jgi:DNA polymerase III subunit epsilon
MLFAVTDIETTGSFAEGNAIVEIGIIITDGQNIIDSFQTLINPKRPLDYYISKMTGITNAMLATAPEWAAVCQTIYEKLDGKIFVAHNVQFDYSFIQHHLRAAGYQFNAPKLCTIKLMRKHFPGMPKYGLQHLIAHYKIPVAQHHRAFCDAKASYFLLKLCIEKVGLEAIEQFATKPLAFQNISPYLAECDFDNLPAKAGVYYFLNDKRKILYIGKAKNIKKRVLQHFYGKNESKRKQDLIKQVRYIQHKNCVNELHAALTEIVEIKTYWPAWNKSQKFGESLYGLYKMENRVGQLQYYISKQKLTVKPIVLHPNKNVLHGWVRQAAQLQQVCYCLAGVGKKKECTGTQCQQFNASPAEHNTRIKAMGKLLYNQPHYIFHQFEKKEGHFYILVENGLLTGWGISERFVKPSNLAAVKKLISPIRENMAIRKMLVQLVNNQPENIYWIKIK